jgi:hypothetical protein
LAKPPQDRCLGLDREGPFKVYDARSTGMIGDLVKKLNRLEPADWEETTLIYRLEE